MNKDNYLGVFIAIVVTFIVFGIFAFIMVTTNVSINAVPTETLEGINTIKSLLTSPLFLIILILIILAITALAKYNKMISLNLKSEQAAKIIDVYLKQRFDLIPNLVEIVNAYTKYEQEILKEIIELRKQYINEEPISANESIEIDNKCNNFLVKIESYPELKANESYLSLQRSLSKVESQLQAARRIYNMETTNYNMYISKFPSNIFAKMYGFKMKILFQVLNSQKENVSVKY